MIDKLRFCALFHVLATDLQYMWCISVVLTIFQHYLNIIISLMDAKQRRQRICALSLGATLHYHKNSIAMLLNL